MFGHERQYRLDPRRYPYERNQHDVHNHHRWLDHHDRASWSIRIHQRRTSLRCIVDSRIYLEIKIYLHVKMVLST